MKKLLNIKDCLYPIYNDDEDKIESYRKEQSIDKDIWDNYLSWLRDLEETTREVIWGQPSKVPYGE